MSHPEGLPAFAGARFLHTMIRVGDLDRSLAFYVDLLGMRLLRREDFEADRFTLAFVGYGEESSTTVLELTYNWDTTSYVAGTAFGHVSIGVNDIYGAERALAEAGVPIVRPAGPLRGKPEVLIAFVLDPDEYRIELIQRSPIA